MKFQVTAEDIMNGVPNSPCECPVALCVKRTMNATFCNAYGLDISAMKTEAGLITCLLMRKTPKRVREFMEDFDDHLPVSPFEFELTEKI